MTKKGGEHFLFESLVHRLQPYDSQTNLLAQDRTSDPADIDRFSEALAEGFTLVTSSVPNPEWIVQIACQLDYNRSIYTDEQFARQLEYDLRVFSDANHIKLIQSIASSQGVSRFFLTKNIGLGWINDPEILENISVAVTQSLINGRCKIINDAMIRIGQSLETSGVANIISYRTTLPELINRPLLIENSLPRYEEWLKRL